MRWSRRKNAADLRHRYMCVVSLIGRRIARERCFIELARIVVCRLKKPETKTILLKFQINAEWMINAHWGEIQLEHLEEMNKRKFVHSKTIRRETHRNLRWLVHRRRLTSSVNQSSIAFISGNKFHTFFRILASNKSGILLWSLFLIESHLNLQRRLAT